MTRPHGQNVALNRPTERTQAEMFGPLSADATRAIILRSRAISEGEARLAAALDAAAPGCGSQSSEDAFELPRRDVAGTAKRV